MKRHIETITDCLLGAAFADKQLEGREIETIRGILIKLSGGELPPTLEARFTSFSPAAFDVEAAGHSLRELGDDRRRVLEMVAAVSESDDEIDLAEDRFLRTLAVAMGLQEKRFRDLIVDFQEIDELEGILGDTLGI